MVSVGGVSYEWGMGLCNMYLVWSLHLYKHPLCSSTRPWTIQERRVFHFRIGSPRTARWDAIGDLHDGSLHKSQHFRMILVWKPVYLKWPYNHVILFYPSIYIYINPIIFPSYTHEHPISFGHLIWTFHLRSEKSKTSWAGPKMCTFIVWWIAVASLRFPWRVADGGCWRTGRWNDQVILHLDC